MDYLHHFKLKHFLSTSTFLLSTIIVTACNNSRDTSAPMLPLLAETAPTSTAVTFTDPANHIKITILPNTLSEDVALYLRQ